MSAVRSVVKMFVPKPLREQIRCQLNQEYRDRWTLARDVEMGRVVYEHAGPIVRGGPFKGMIYPAADSAFTLGPKLLGVYEMELNDIVDKLIAAEFCHIVNVGSGEGYYAVGLCRRLPQARVIAFEADEGKRGQLKAVSAANGVADRIDLHGFAGPEDVERTLDADHPLLICDVEGAEQELLDPETVPSLKKATILVEMHDILRKGVSRIVQARFDATHRLTVIATRTRHKSDWPAGLELHPRYQACLTESRGGRMTWCLFEPTDA